MGQWRLIDDRHTIGSRNMGVDHAILRAVGAGDQPPTLRLYGWVPPCLSLGYGQRSGDVDLRAVDERGWTLVRRPTGGRAILHIDELTYSIALPIHHELARGSVVESYSRISRALMCALIRLGVQPQAVPMLEGVEKSTTPVCFDMPSHYEITVAGKKLIGSAQMRREGGVLQHGSFPMSGDIARICNGLKYASEDERETAKALVRGRAATLADVSGQIFDYAAVAKAFKEGVAETFDVTLIDGELTLAEQRDAERLEAELYANEAWTFRR